MSAVAISRFEFDFEDTQPWRGKTGLLSIVIDAVETVDWKGKNGTFSIRPTEAFDSNLLLTLLSYCYSTGTFSSEDIEAVARTNRILSPLFEESAPDWKTIRRFRRLHRQAVHDCISYIVRQALLIRFGEGDDNGDLLPPDHCVAVALDRWFEPLCAPCPSEEASDRIQKAVSLDELILD